MVLPPSPTSITLLRPEQLDVAAALVRETEMTVDVQAELDRPFAHLWLAWHPERPLPAGFLLAWDVADELHVLDVATHPAVRRRGVARALLQHALDHARDRAARVALLEVRASNAAAIALYASHGFAETNVRERYYADGEDALEMALSLPTAARPSPVHHQPET